jgi:hypothetical protein
LWPSLFRSKYSQHSLPVYIMFFPHCQTQLFTPINIQRCNNCTIVRYTNTHTW